MTRLPDRIRMELASYGKRSTMNVSSSATEASRSAKEFPVVCVGGSAGGLDAYVRLSFATSMAQIDKGLDRLAKLLG